MNRREVRLAFLVVVGMGSAVVTGCEEEFSDEKFGVLDLAPVYDGSPSNPAVPDEISVTRGFVDGAGAEYYDFGVVPTIIDPIDGSPLAVRVQPMYFFYDAQQRPLFSRPVRELRDGTDWIRGGRDVLNPNPKDHCAGATDMEACAALNEIERKKSYPLRTRDPLGDANREGSDDYQRPLIDLTPQDNQPPRQQYTGLWEIIEIVAPGGYQPDSIKHVATLDKAVAAGKFKKRATGKVINCPLVDGRTYVNSGITSRRVLRPRIELWYRRLLATCFLANGWETMGLPDGTPLFAGIDNDRIDTFDVARVRVSQDPNAVPELVVPVGRAYEPVVIPPQGGGATVARIDDNVLSSTQPRRQAGDPTGYSPMRWMFDVPAPAEYQPGGWKSVADVDPSKAIGRADSFVDPIVKNLPLRGVAQPCSFVPNYDTVNPNRPTQRLKQCGKKISEPGKRTRFDPLGDPVCNAERDPFNPNDRPLECNKDTCFCDAPVVGYGEACGPGLARCSRDADNFSSDGYRCFPPWGGFCQRSCEGTNSQSLENNGKEPKDWVDSRCGGTPGFICLGGLNTCAKYCDQNIRNPQQCSVSMMVGTETRDIQEGQTCQDFGVAVCAWPDTWTPRPFPIPE